MWEKHRRERQGVKPGSKGARKARKAEAGKEVARGLGWREEAEGPVSVLSSAGLIGVSRWSSRGGCLVSLGADRTEGPVGGVRGRSQVWVIRDGSGRRRSGREGAEGGRGRGPVGEAEGGRSGGLGMGGAEKIAGLIRPSGHRKAPQ